jgi:hypothetical protein
VLQRFFSPGPKVETFMNSKGKIETELYNEKCLWDFTLPCDIISPLNNLNTYQQVQQEPICNVFGSVRAF